MLRMPEDIEKMYDEWVAAQTDPMHPTEKPQELKDYLEHEKAIIEKAEANGCMIG